MDPQNEHDTDSIELPTSDLTSPGQHVNEIRFLNYFADLMKKTRQVWIESCHKVCSGISEPSFLSSSQSLLLLMTEIRL